MKMNTCKCERNESAWHGVQSTLRSHMRNHVEHMPYMSVRDAKQVIVQSGVCLCTLNDLNWNVCEASECLQQIRCMCVGACAMCMCVCCKRTIDSRFILNALKNVQRSRKNQRNKYETRKRYMGENTARHKINLIQSHCTSMDSVNHILYTRYTHGCNVFLHIVAVSFHPSICANSILLHYFSCSHAFNHTQTHAFATLISCKDSIFCRAHCVCCEKV